MNQLLLLYYKVWVLRLFLLFSNLCTPKLVAGTLYATVGAIDAQGRINNANILINGDTVLEGIYDALNKNSSYSRIEVTVFFREYTNPDGTKVRADYGNSTTKGKN
ncbi:hypothetical protein H9636_18920 [Ureibacillus sp. Re31]|uniref:Uncharacterized protein n=1 Tax=Ureibacillus galli TaxID=2762222 RepID=A0ABR8XHK7_9BACL|nr:hypothetical protein [Ureibacillus galli]MBD8028703.1 hypothetical protein [Ureibacillus galli]